MKINKKTSAGLGLLTLSALFPLSAANAATEDKAPAMPTINVVDSETGDKINGVKVEINAFTRADKGGTWVNANNEKLSSTANVNKLLEKFTTKATNCDEATLKVAINEVGSDISHSSDATTIDLCKTVNGWIVGGADKNVSLKDNTLTIKNISKLTTVNSVEAETETLGSKAADSKDVTASSSPSASPSTVEAKTSETNAKAADDSSATPSSSSTASTSETSAQASNSTGISVTGNVFKDANGDGNFNGNDSAFKDISVSLIKASDNSTIKTVKTDGNGNYSFDDVDSGSYNVKVNNPSGSTFTRVFNDTVGSITNTYAQVDIGGSDSSVTNVDFGINVNDTNSNGNNSATPSSTASSTSTTTTPTKSSTPTGTTPKVVTLPKETKTPTVTKSSTPKATKTVAPKITKVPTTVVNTTPVTTQTNTPVTTVDPCTKYSNEAEAAAAGYTCTTVSDSTIQTGELKGGVNKLALVEGASLFGFGGLMVRRAFRKN